MELLMRIVSNWERVRLLKKNLTNIVFRYVTAVIHFIFLGFWIFLGRQSRVRIVTTIYNDRVIRRIWNLQLTHINEILIKKIWIDIVETVIIHLKSIFGLYKFISTNRVNSKFDANDLINKYQSRLYFKELE